MIDGLERLGSVVVEETDVSEKSKPNTCTLCKLDFNFVYELTAHFSSFHPQVKFCCYECHKVFSKTELLFNHLLEKHEVQNPEKSKVALFDESRHVLARVGFLEGVQKSHEVTEFWRKALKIKEPKIKKLKMGFDWMAGFPPQLESHEVGNKPPWLKGTLKIMIII